MAEIVDNCLLLRIQKNFNNKLLSYFFDRLQLFLMVSYDKKEYPKVLFTNNISKILEKDPEYKNNRAFFDEEHNYIVFNADKYNIMSDDFKFKKSEEISILRDENKQYKYYVLLSDIYHENIHAIQFNSIGEMYNYTDFIEAIDEIFTYIITGQENIDYIKESIAFWYVCRKILKVNLNKFYIMLRDAIVDENFTNIYLFSNKKFINLLSKNYKGDIKIFYNNFKNDFGDVSLKENFIKDLNNLHNLIFYKF